MQAIENEFDIHTQNTIAVLPFVNMSSDAEQEYFSDGISEEIINRLAQLSSLKVVGRTSSFSFKGKNQDLRQIGDQLNVNYILEGSVRKSGNKLRITVQLINVNDGFQLYSDKFDKEIKDIFDIQDEISLAILNAIKIKLLAVDKAGMLKKSTVNPDAYQLYLKGRFYNHQYAFLKAIEYFESAINLEPNYALAHANLASSFLFSWLYNVLPADESLPKMKQAAQRSFQLDDEIAESRLAVARMKMYYEWNFEAAEIEYKNAISLSPNLSEVHEQYAYFLSVIGDFSAAIKHALIALDLDPFSLMNNYHVASVYWMAADYEKELEFGQRLIKINPDFHAGHLILGDAFQGMQRYEEAVQEFELAARLNHTSATLFYLATVYGIIGDKSKVVEVLEKMKDLRKAKLAGNYDMGIVYMALGEYDTAFQYLEEALENNEPYLLALKFHIRHFPNFVNDPRTKMILSKIGLK